MTEQNLFQGLTTPSIEHFVVFFWKKMNEYNISNVIYCLMNKELQYFQLKIIKMK